MLRYFILFIISVLFFSCDDGNFDVETFDFSSGTTNSCNQETNNFFVYRLSTNEALIIRIPESTFNYEVTPLVSPNTLDPILINGSTIQVVYRLYNAPISTNTICSFLPPIAPNVVDEWVATSGNIRIVTNVTKANNTGINSPNATSINGYNHEIEFRDITFLKGNGTEQFYDVLSFGSFQTASLNTLSNFTGSPVICQDDTRKVLYKISENGNQYISLNLPNSLFINEVTLLNQPRVEYFNSDNTFNYFIFSDPLANNNVFCTGDFEELENWIAEDGNPSAQTGVIEVTTVQSSEGFEHTIVLKKAVMKKGEVDFTFGDAYNFGTIVTAP